TYEYASDVIFGRYPPYPVYDKIVLEHEVPTLVESYSHLPSPIRVTMYFALCANTPVSGYPAPSVHYTPGGQLTNAPEQWTDLSTAINVQAVHVFGLFNRIRYNVGGNWEVYPNVPINQGAVGQVGFGARIDGQIPGNILVSVPINQLYFGNYLPGNINFAAGPNLGMNNFLMNAPCANRYAFGFTPFAFVQGLTQWVSTAKVIPNPNFGEV
ncbi:MAG: hypothetical protein RMM53_11175, partial [Bacteroidia bacterium]|nr:hypothetical protein [Bacteroidia bacterium]